MEFFPNNAEEEKEEYQQDPNKLKEVLDQADKSQKKEIALKLIEGGESKYVARNIEKFEGLDKEIALKLIERGCELYVARNIEKFEGVSLNKEIALKLIERDCQWYVANNIEKFEGLDKEIALKLIEKCKGECVIINIEKFEGIPLNKEIALKLIEKGEGWRVVDNIEKFEGLDKEIALKLIEKGSKEYVANNIEKFEGRLDKEIALKLIEIGAGWCVVNNIKKFEGLDKEIALKLIERGCELYVANNIEKFEGVSLNKEIALKLIERGEGCWVVDNIEKFEGIPLNKEIALKLIGGGVGWWVVNNIKKFKGISLNKEIALKFIEEGGGECVIINIKKFKGISLNKEIALKFIEEGGGFRVVNNIEKFEGVSSNKEITLKLIEEGDKGHVANNIEKFEGLDKEIALKLIEKGVGWCVARNIEKFEGLDKEIALKLIEKGESEYVARNIEKFGKPLVFDKTDAKKIIEGGDEIFIMGLLDEGKVSDFFPFLDENFFERVKKTHLRLFEAIFVEDFGDDNSENEKEEFYRKTFNGLKMHHEEWKDRENVLIPFENGAEYFGYEKMFRYMDRKDLSRHDALFNFQKIVEIAKESDLTPQQFFNNILIQVQKDNSRYEEGTAHHKLNSLVNSINKNFSEVIEECKAYSNVKKMQKLIGTLDSPQRIFKSWKTLKKYEEICQLLNKREIMKELQALKKEGKEKLYTYVDTLAFHEGISMQDVLKFWRNPEDFLGIMDVHTPNEVQDRKKPSNYVKIPHLDLAPQELRDALVEGAYDRLQVFRPLEVVYGFHEQISDLQELIYEAVGKRSENKKGKAQNPGKTFSSLSKLFKKEGIKLQDFLQSADPKKDFPKIFEIKDSVIEIVNDESFGIFKSDSFKYRAKIVRKSDPDGVVAGNDTACCMPFGSGKNNVYTFNPICSLFIIQKKNGDKWKTVAQSVLTKDKDIKQNISKIKNKFEDGQSKMDKIINEKILLDAKGIITCDNVEITPNFKDNNHQNIIEIIYEDFFGKYLEKFSKIDNLDQGRIIIGKGHSDGLTNLPEIENTFIPEAPIGYSDNLHKKAWVLKVGNEGLKGKIQTQKVSQETIEKRKEKIELPKGVSFLDFQDSLLVAYIESKAYKDNESLMEFLHNMENALIAKDVNNEMKERPNLSFKYTDEKGKTHGYILAYEGRFKDENRNDPVIYVADLASDGFKKAGGSLMLGFIKSYKKNYIDKNNLIPILAEFREKTSYKIVKKQLDRIGKKIGVTFEMEELNKYQKGEDTMHSIILKPIFEER